MRYLLFLSVLLSLPVMAQLSLTAEQQDYLRRNPQVSLCVDPDWVPFEALDSQGRHEGIAADLLRLLASRAGLSLRIHPTRNWEASLAASRAGDCQLLSFLNQSAERDAWLLFTDPIFNDGNVLISREEHPRVDDLAEFVGSRMALPAGTSVETRLRRDYPGLEIILTESEAQALALVNERQAELTMRSLTVAAYTIKKEGWFNLKIAGQVQGYDSLFRIGVLRSEPVLRDILNQAIATLTPEEVNGIVNRHVAIRVESPTDYRLFFQLLVVFGVILLSNLFWVARLRRANRQLEEQSLLDVLTGLANRKQLNGFSQICFELSRRHERPMAVVMFDIDYFKKVNDQLGHLAGDKVLKEVAQLLSASVRKGDCLGRWGGEEFLLICPETTQESAIGSAERVLEKMRHCRFSTGQVYTLSAGVAQLAPGENLDELIQRADDALYAAKEAGRDRVCAANSSPVPGLVLGGASELDRADG